MRAVEADGPVGRRRRGSRRWPPRQAGPYPAQSGSTPLAPAAFRQDRRRHAASPSGQGSPINPPETNGMSQATHTTGAGASTTAV